MICYLYLGKLGARVASPSSRIRRSRLVPSRFTRRNSNERIDRFHRSAKSIVGETNVALVPVPDSFRFEAVDGARSVLPLERPFVFRETVPRGNSANRFCGLFRTGNKRCVQLRPIRVTRSSKRISIGRFRGEIQRFSKPTSRRPPARLHAVPYGIDVSSWNTAYRGGPFGETIHNYKTARSNGITDRTHCR